MRTSENVRVRLNTIAKMKRKEASSHASQTIDVKSVIAGMLLVGFVAFPGNLWKDRKAVVLVAQQLLNQFPAGETMHSKPCNTTRESAVPPRPLAEQTGDKFVIKRNLNAYGSAAALFVQLGAYRGGADSFAVVGLASKPIHVYGNAGFECEWVPAGRSSAANVWVKGKVSKLLPDGNMGRQFTVVVVNCSFAQPVGVDRKGGELVLCASYGVGSGKNRTSMERIVALKEAQGEYDERKFRPPYPYDFVCCGFPLVGAINPQRIREWMAYHTRLLGPRGHFVLYDAGGLSPSVRTILQPWLDLGYVSLHDVRQQARFDGYDDNQFLILNDCFHRTRFLSNWTFFFGVDEFLYVPRGLTLQSVMTRFSNYTQVIYQQLPMSSDICEAGRRHSSDWGFEKLIYRNVKRGISWNRRYAIQSRNAFATGLNRSDHVIGASLGLNSTTRVPNIRYYRFHDVLPKMGELCQEFAKAADPAEAAVIYDSKGVPFRADRRLQRLASSAKRFEWELIGALPAIERQI